MSGVSIETEALVNLNHLASLTGSREESACEEILELFIFNSGECLSAMAHGLQPGHEYQWKMAICELKALSDMVGALGIHEACVMAEMKAEADAAVRRNTTEHIRQELHKLRMYMRRAR